MLKEELHKGVPGECRMLMLDCLEPKIGFTFEIDRGKHDFCVAIHTGLMENNLLALSTHPRGFWPSNLGNSTFGIL